MKTLHDKMKALSDIRVLIQDVPRIETELRKVGLQAEQLSVCFNINIEKR